MPISDFEYAIQSGSFAGLPRLVNIEHEVATLTGIVRNVRDSRFAGGAVGSTDGSSATQDTTAFQLALTAAAGGTLQIPPPRPGAFYAISSELLYDAAALGTVRIAGLGAGSILKATGASNKVLHITGTAGVTSPFISIENLQIQSATSGTSSAGIHLDGIALFWLHDVVIQGNSKITDGIRCTAAQQGEISGGFIRGCVTGIREEPSGGIHSNGIEIHGVSMTTQSGAHIVLDSLDSGFIHSNHMTGAPICIDIVASGNGYTIVRDNHFESHTTAGIRSVAGPQIVGNQFFTGGGGTDIKLLSGAGQQTISDNFFGGNVVFDSGTSGIKLLNNRFLAGTLTDNSTGLIRQGNTGTISDPIITCGAGSPEGVVTAGVGSLFMRTDAATSLYVKQTGVGNVGWIAK